MKNKKISYITTMGGLTISNKVLNKYFEYLKRFDDETKKKLIIKLSNSLGSKEKKVFNLKSIFGAWEDERSSKEIVSEIRKSRAEPRTIEKF